jgi:hypothetical protein
MSRGKVREITVDVQKHFEAMQRMQHDPVSSRAHYDAAHAETATLRRDIIDLATREKETVYFHQFKGDFGGAPCLLVECGDAFFEKVKQLPFFADAFDPPRAPEGTETFRFEQAGPFDPYDIKEAFVRTSRNHDARQLAYGIIDAAVGKGLEGQVLLREVFRHAGFVRFSCPDDFVDEVRKLASCDRVDVPPPRPRTP